MIVRRHICGISVESHNLLFHQKLRSHLAVRSLSNRNAQLSRAAYQNESETCHFPSFITIWLDYRVTLPQANIWPQNPMSSLDRYPRTNSLNII